VPKQPTAKPVKQSEDLISEAYKNLQDDREKINEFADLLEKAAKVGEDLDPLAKIAMVESFTKLSSELTKNNALFLDLIKIRVKKEAPAQRNKNGFDDDEMVTMFDEIEFDAEEDGGSN